LISAFSHAPPTTQLDTLSLHDALPISEIEQLGGRARDVMQLPATDPTRASRLHAVVAEAREAPSRPRIPKEGEDIGPEPDDVIEDRKSTRLNSSHVKISYAVFCLKKKK